MIVHERVGEQPPDDATLIVHMGAGDRHHLLRTAMRNYDLYRALRSDGYGHFALSVYAAQSGHPVEELVQAVSWKQYGVCTAGIVREHFPLLATTILNDDGEVLDELQVVHFDVLLPNPDDVRLSEVDALGLDEDNPGLILATEAHLGPFVEQFVDLFAPRQRKTSGDGTIGRTGGEG